MVASAFASLVKLTGVVIVKGGTDLRFDSLANDRRTMLNLRLWGVDRAASIVSGGSARRGEPLLIDESADDGEPPCGLAEDDFYEHGR